MPFCQYLGHGIGLRPVHYREVIEGRPPIGWLEIISENFMVAGGNPRRVLRDVRGNYPVAMHGVSLSLGSTDPLVLAYLDELAALADDVEPAWISDHLCWSSLGGHTVHDLWPLPYTEEALNHVAARVARVQDRLGRQIQIENVSSYLTYRHSTLTEWDFLAELAERADCGILLDVNKVYVSAHNHGFDPRTFVAAMPRGRVGQIHLAGHQHDGALFLDTHDHPVCDEVWDLYRDTVRRCGRVSTLIEWDDEIPALGRLLEESRRAMGVEAEAIATPREASLRAP